MLQRLVSLLIVAAASAQPPPQPELTTHDAPAVFTSRVNLVAVPVVVRDRNGRAVGDLTKDDFRLSDSGKPQEITRFSIEKPDTPVVLEKETPSPGAPAQPATPAAAVANRFVAYLFDDLHSNSEELVRTRDAAAKLLAEPLPLADRVAIFTTSGLVTLEFTSDSAALNETLLRLQPRPLAINTSADCPALSFYEADLIENKHDMQALRAAIVETFGCSNSDPTRVKPEVMEQMVHSTAGRTLAAGEQQTRSTIQALSKAVNRMALMPGQRTLVLASPGFITPLLHQEVAEVINRAIRSKVVIGSLDSRGLTVSPGSTAGERTFANNAEVMPVRNRNSSEAALAQQDVLGELAEGTGGIFVRNSNDLLGGLRRLATPPEFIYVLGFSPQNLKADGKLHSLKVTLREPRDYTLQARRGFYAPRREEDEASQARQDLEAAVFSREVMKEIPVELNTQFFKSSEADAKLTVLARIDLKSLHYRKQDGRNHNTVAVVAALFDPSGNFISASEKDVDLRLKDETLEKRLGSGVTIKISFDVKVGSYIVRLVVRDSDSRWMAAENGAVDVP